VSLTTLVDSPVITGEFLKSSAGQRSVTENDIARQRRRARRPADAGTITRAGRPGRLATSLPDYHFLYTLSDHVAPLPAWSIMNRRQPRQRTLSGRDNRKKNVGCLLPHEYVHSWTEKFRRRRPGHSRLPAAHAGRSALVYEG